VAGPPDDLLDRQPLHEIQAADLRPLLHPNHNLLLARTPSSEAPDQPGRHLQRRQGGQLSTGVRGSVLNRCRHPSSAIRLKGVPSDSSETYTSATPPRTRLPVETRPSLLDTLEAAHANPPAQSTSSKEPPPIEQADLLSRSWPAPLMNRQFYGRT
jgi:hypothetical protein